MRFWIKAVWAGPGAALLALAAAADPVGPLEQPPEDFAGQQYIDTAGCVYVRQGSVWAPRLDRDGSVICGYPPSLPGLATKPVEHPDDAPLRLAVTLAEQLQDGDVLADPPDLLRRDEVAVPEPKSGPLSELATAISAAPQMRAAATWQAGGPTPLCAILGYDAAGPGAGSGGDQALGFCSGGDVSLQPKVVAVAAPASTGPGDAATQAAARQADGDAAKAQPVPVAKAGIRADAASGPAAPADPRARNAPEKPAIARATTGTGRPAADVEMIPAGARYVRIGHYTDPAEAEAAMRRLAALGYPVARSKTADAGTGGRAVLAGPFTARQAVVSALNHLRKAGYPQARAQ